jgi:hypothetical protein
MPTYLEILRNFNICVAYVLGREKIGYIMFCVVCMSAHELMVSCRHYPCIDTHHNF